MSTQPHQPQGFAQQVLGDTTGLHNHNNVVEGNLSKLVEDINPKTADKKQCILRRHLVCTLKYFRRGDLCPLTSSDLLRNTGVTLNDIRDFCCKNKDAFLLEKTRKYQEAERKKFTESRRRNVSTPPPGVNWNGSVW